MLIASLLVATLPATTAFEAPLGTETRLTTDPGNSARPAIWGDRVVYEDSRNGNTDIFMLDLSTGEERALTTNASEQTRPAIWEDRVVWVDSRYPVRAIQMLNLSTGKEVRLYESKENQRNPAIWGDIVVWEQQVSGQWDIYGQDLATGKTRALVASDFAEGGPDIDGDTLVWSDNRSGLFDLYALDLATGRETRLTYERYGASGAAVHGDWVAYTGGATGDVHVLHLPSHDEVVLMQDLYYQGEIDIWGDVVVWNDPSGGNPDIMMYDITTGEVRQVTHHPATQMLPALWEDRLVWTDMRNDATDIYMLTLDRDGDGVGDASDAFPWNPHEFRDSDGDGMGDSIDPDDDGNGVDDDKEVQAALGAMAAMLGEDLAELRVSINGSLDALGATFMEDLETVNISIHNDLKVKHDTAKATINNVRAIVADNGNGTGEIQADTEEMIAILQEEMDRITNMTDTVVKTGDGLTSLQADMAKLDQALAALEALDEALREAKESLSDDVAASSDDAPTGMGTVTGLTAAVLVTSLATLGTAASIRRTCMGGGKPGVGGGGSNPVQGTDRTSSMSSIDVDEPGMAGVSEVEGTRAYDKAHRLTRGTDGRSSGTDRSSTGDHTAAHEAAHVVQQDPGEAGTVRSSASGPADDGSQTVDHTAAHEATHVVQQRGGH